MPSDLCTYAVLARELKDDLTPGKVRKIGMPEKDEVRLTVFKDRVRTLVFSFHPDVPYVLSDAPKKENPAGAPSFCMLLRKHLSNALLTDVSVFNGDRIIRADFETGGKTFSLFCELTGRCCCLVFTDENGRILGCAGGGAKAKNRNLAAGAPYEPPPKTGKPSLADLDGIKRLLLSTPADTPADALLKSADGLSRRTAAEIVFRAGSGFPIAEKDADAIISQIAVFNGIYGTPSFVPCVLPGSKDYFVSPYLSLADRESYVEKGSLGEAAALCYALSDGAVRRDRRIRETAALAKKYASKLEKKISGLRSKLVECAGMENVRRDAELLAANVWRIKRGDSSVSVEDYYDSNAPRSIPLDETKTPKQNVAALYARYGKLKRARAGTEEALERCLPELEYVRTIEDELTRAEEADLPAVRDELAALGAIKKQTVRRGGKTPVRAAPRSYVLDGFEIVAGTNNVLNEDVTFGIGRSRDVWLHVKDLHGSHVIIRRKADEEIPEAVLLSAAETAAYYSEGRNGENVPVDFTERKFVRRIRNAGPGMVSYSGHRTVYVSPKDNSTKKEE